MCCRYYMEESPEIRPYVEAARRSPLLEKMVAHLARPLIASGEVRPTNIVPVIAPSRKKEPAVYPMVWGFTGKLAPLVNARSETAAGKPTFRESWEKRRCVIPASWYFEWEHQISPDGKQRTGDKYMIQPLGAKALFLAGLYRMETQGDLTYPVFTVLTKEPTEALRLLHDRMPVILPRSEIAAWIDPDGRPEAILGSALRDMITIKAV